jgi:hypothetical protein
MTQISSQMTRFYKYVFPVIWFGILAFIVVTAVTSGTAVKTPVVVLVPCVMVILGVFIFKRLIWNLADVVQDGGDFLLVKYRGYEERVPLTNIMNVSVSTNMNPPRLTLRLVKPAPFGSEIAFFPVRPFSMNPFARNPVAEDLIVRVHNAQTRRAS